MLLGQQGRSQEFATGGQKRESGDGSPPAGPEAEPRWGKPPEAGDKC